MSNGIIFAAAFSMLAGLTGYRIGILRERWHQYNKTLITPPRGSSDGEYQGSVGQVRWDYQPTNKK